MLIYQNRLKEFIKESKENTLTGTIIDNFVSYFGYHPHESQIRAWQNSLPRVRDLVELAELDDNMIAVEYEVPYNQNRIDCLLFGKGEDDGQNVVLLELKQWSQVTALEDEGNFVETHTGGRNQIVPHPSQQVKGYHSHLQSFVFRHPKWNKPVKIREQLFGLFSYQLDKAIYKRFRLTTIESFKTSLRGFCQHIDRYY